MGILSFMLAALLALVILWGLYILRENIDAIRRWRK